MAKTYAPFRSWSVRSGCGACCRVIRFGLLWPVISKLGLGRLPGDIVIDRENFRLYIPIVTSIVVSVVLSLLWLLNR
jgi:DUF2905 family protein